MWNQVLLAVTLLCSPLEKIGIRGYLIKANNERVGGVNRQTDSLLLKFFMAPMNAYFLAVVSLVCSCDGAED